MGLFSKSSSSTTQLVTNNDNRQALEGSIGISGDGSSIALSTVNNIQMLDGGAIAAGRDVTLAAIATNRAATESAIYGLNAGNKNALDFGQRVTDSAFKAIGADRDVTNKVVNDALKLISDNSAVAQRNTSEAWKQAIDAKNGTAMGDYKIIFLAIAGVFGLWALKGRG